MVVRKLDTELNFTVDVAPRPTFMHAITKWWPSRLRRAKYGHSRGRGSTNVDDPEPRRPLRQSSQEALPAYRGQHIHVGCFRRQAWHEFCFFLFRLGVPPQAYEGPPLVWCVRPDQGLSRGFTIHRLSFVQALASSSLGLASLAAASFNSAR